MNTYSSALVLGLGASGEAAARLLLSEGTKVTAIDARDGGELSRRAQALEALGAEVRLGTETLPESSASVCVVSPGVPLGSSWISDAGASCGKLISELELGWSRAKCRTLAITGSNGKSTLVELCAQALERFGFQTAIAGNHEERETGRPMPVCGLVSERRTLDWLVLEVSSFQLETVDLFRPDVGLLLNIFPNHFDRHGNMEIYRDTKLRLFAKMTSRDTGIAPAALFEDNTLPSGSGRPRWVSFGAAGTAAYRYSDGKLLAGGEELLRLSGTDFDNEVLGPGAAAAAAAISACGAGLNHLETALRAFKALPHRLEEIGYVGGVRFVNDSKASNVEAAGAALRIASGSIRLIAGGKPKGDDYSRLLKDARGKVLKAYLIGEAAEAMAEAWQGSMPCAISRTLDKAVEDAFDDSTEGDTILLSPGCASLDQFENYRDRGDKFRRRVKELQKKT